MPVGGSEIPYLRLWSHYDEWSRSWHGWFLGHSFLIRNSFYNDIFVDVRFKRFGRREKIVALIANTSTFVPHDRPQCPFCVLPIMLCACGAPLDVGLAERRTLCRFIGTAHVSFSRFRENGCLLIRRNRYEELISLCNSHTMIKFGNIKATSGYSFLSPQKN